MKRNLVIYHRADFDGIFCREIAKKFLGETAHYAGWDYGDPDPVILEGIEKIFLLDISIEGLMGDPRLIWIDHHKSAIEKYSDTVHGNFGTQYTIDGVAACRLAWQFFSGFPALGDAADLPVRKDYVDRTVNEPLAVRLAGEYDIWDKREPRADLFQFGLKSQPMEGMWPLLLQAPKKLSVDVSVPFVEKLLDQGISLKFYQAQSNESIIREMGFDFEWEGLLFLACNHARFNSHLFTAGLRPEHDACFGFKWTGTQWGVSLYHAPGKEHHDLSAIAVKYGGGGHRGACGFRTKKLPFLK